MFRKMTPPCAAMLAAVVGLAPTISTAKTVKHQASQSVAGTSIKVVVNGVPLTNDDIAKRVAFLKLQRKTGDLQKLAQQQMIDEILKRQEIARVHMSVSTDDVDQAYDRFATSNKMTKDQLNTILSKTGVTVQHFKNYIAVSMSWPRVVNAKYGSGKQMSQDDLVKRMTENREKPSTTEYFLKDIIFVIPESKKNLITKQRQAEAEASRAKFPGCDQAKVFAATMHDVSVRDLGRVMEPALPSDWKPLVQAATGNTTATRVTGLGVEYLAICSKRTVSDDAAAEAVFKAEDLGKAGDGQGDANDKKFVEELEKKAQITYP